MESRLQKDPLDMSSLESSLDIVLSPPTIERVPTEVNLTKWLDKTPADKKDVQTSSQGLFKAEQPPKTKEIEKTHSACPFIPG